MGPAFPIFVVEAQKENNNPCLVVLLFQNVQYATRKSCN